MWSALVAAIAAFIFSSFVEYWVHRLMHASEKLGSRHRDHHRRNEGQGVVLEFFDYVKGAGLAMIAPLGFTWFFATTWLPIGMGWLAGALIYAAFSAYAHQLQHENPIKCFWMKMPVHYVHHKYGMWDHNFGLGVDWWDHIFGTYKLVNWVSEKETALADRGHLQLRWW